tara:strand:- start:1489 stop:3780 length:2292 start_codon:yes stop_codon:yes gene_type:complete
MMQSIDTPPLKPSRAPACWMAAALVTYGIFYFSNGLVFERMHAGDGADNFVMFSYQYSGLLRGEYPLWNPLNRTGEPLYLMQALFMANPISNITIITSAIFGVTNIFLAFLFFNYILITAYVTGIYQLILTLTKSHHSAAFGGILSLGSGLIFQNMYTNTQLLLIHSIPWICYGFINYLRSFHFKHLGIFILALIASIYSYEVVYTLCFLFLAALSGLIFYKDFFPINMLNRIPKQHLYFIVFSLLIGSAPMALIVFKAFGGSYLPPGTRFDVAQMALQKDLSFDTDVAFNKLNKFFFTCENCMTVLFTGAFWGKYVVARHYLGPLVFPFLMVALLARTKVIYCISLTILLVSMLAGDIFPVNILYQLPLIQLIKYGVVFNLYVKLLLIILAALGFDLFFNHPCSSRKTHIIWSGILVIFGCALLALILPQTPISNAGILMTSIITLILISLVYTFNIASFNKLAIIVLIVTVVSGITYHYNIRKAHPIFNGVNYKASEFSDLRNRIDHSLKFSMERPDSLLISKHGVHPNGPSSLSSEYYSFIGLEENTYQAPIENRGIGSFPILKNHIIFRSLPGSDLLLRNKFFLFDKVFLSDNSSYFSDLKKQPELLKKLLENNIGVVDFPGDPRHPAYSGQLDPEAILSSRKDNPSAKILSLDVTKFNANSIKLNLVTSKPGILLYTDTWDNGWHAKINGNSVPVLKVFHTFKGVELMKGEYDIEFYFHNSVLSSLIFFNATYFVLFIFVVVNFVAGRLKNNSKPELV